MAAANLSEASTATGVDGHGSSGDSISDPPADQAAIFRPGEAASQPEEAGLAEKGRSGGEDGDAFAVDWDGPTDPANPRNWSRTRKTASVVLVSCFVFYSNLATTMFAPGADSLAKEFGVTNDTVIALTVTIAVLGFSMGPLVFAPASELFGRVPIYNVCGTIYVAFTIGLALSKNVAMFLVFRFICGCAASAFMTCGGGTIADLLPPQERGRAAAVFSAGPLLGPVIGPIIGGFVTEKIGWRWTFWLITIVSGIVTSVAAILMRETNASVLLSRKAARLRKETGNDNYHPINEKNIPVKQLVRRALVRPLRMLVFSPMVLLIALYLALIFGMMYLLFATFPSVFQDTYGFNEGISGLCYLGLGLGLVIGLQMFGRLSDRLLQPRNGDQVNQTVRPERRLILMMWFCPAVPAGIFWYGWTTYYKTHWIVPIIGTGFIGLGALFIFTSPQVYMMDMFGPEGAASALGAITLVRNLSGAFLALAAPSLYARLGLGWGNSVLGFIILAFTPVPFLFYRYGEWLRDRFPVKL